MDEFYIEHAAAVKKIAKAQHRGADHCEPEDVEQAIWEHVIAEFAAYQNAASQDVLDSYFRKAANRFMQAERRDYMYFSGSFMYRPTDVKQILAESTWVDADDAADIEGRVDVQAAWRVLRKKAPAQGRALFKAFGLNTPSKDLSGAEAQAVRDGVDSITHILNEGLRLRSVDVDLVREAA